MHIDSTHISTTQLVPEAIQPVLFNVAISTIDIEFYTKMMSLVLSSAYLLWRWRVDYLKNKKQ